MFKGLYRGHDRLGGAAAAAAAVGTSEGEIEPKLNPIFFVVTTIAVFVSTFTSAAALKTATNVRKFNEGFAQLSGFRIEPPVAIAGANEISNHILSRTTTVLNEELRGVARDRNHGL